MNNQPGQKINLNTASAADLERIRGIGPDLAQAIVVDREQHGLYKDVSDVRRVRGIGGKLYEQIREWICVAEEADATTTESIVFQGEPSRVTGIVQVVNTTDQPMRRVQLRFENSGLLTAVGAPLTEVAIKMSRPRLQPGEYRRMTVSLALDGRTPPGIHQGELVVGDQHLPVVFHIARISGVSVVPATIKVDNRPNTKHVTTVFMTNLGNEPITLGNIGAVEIEETDIVHRAIHDAMNQLEGSGIDVALDAFTGQLKQGFKRGRVLRVYTRNKPVQIPPGETRPVDLEISLPKDMPARQYVGKISIFDASIRLDIQRTLVQRQMADIQ